jgi:hypothetical protein
MIKINITQHNIEDKSHFFKKNIDLFIENFLIIL